MLLRILFPWSRIEPAPLALKSGVLTAGPPMKSYTAFTSFIHYLWGLLGVLCQKLQGENDPASMCFTEPACVFCVCVLEFFQCSRNKHTQWKSERWVSQLCLTLGDPINCSPLGSSVLGILQARILEWVAILISRGSSQPRDQTQVFHTAGRFLTSWATREAAGNPLIDRNTLWSSVGK